MRVAVIFNSGAGSAGSEDQASAIQTAFEKAGSEVTIQRVQTGEQLKSTAQTVIAGECEVVVAAGGDGTVSAVAAAMVGSKKALGVIPLGTLNHFAKDLKIPLDIDSAVDVISRRHVKEVDIAEVNGRYFINNSSIGLYPRLVRKREQRERLGYGKWWAALWAAWRLLRASPFQNVTLDFRGNELRRKTPFVFVGNNRYQMDLYNIGTRATLDEGILNVYLVRRSGRAGLVLLILRTLVGLLRRSNNFEEFQTTRLKVETRKRVVLVAFDGEVSAMETPLEYCIHPRKLRVITPEQKDQ